MEHSEVLWAATKNHPSVAVLKLLLMGGEATLNGYRIKLAARIGGGYSPIIVTTIVNSSGEERPYIMGMDDLPLSHFIKQCEAITEDELTIIGANIALNDIRKERI